MNFTEVEGDGIKSGLPFKTFSTLKYLIYAQTIFVYCIFVYICLFWFFKVSQSKRLKSDIATLEYDLAALKKVGAQQRNDLKSIGNLIMSELKSLREKALEHEESLNKECKISAKFTTELPVMVTSIKVVGSGLTDLRRELTAMKANSTSQLENMEAAVTNLHQNTYEMTTQMSNLEAEHANLRLALHIQPLFQKKIDTNQLIKCT